MLNTKYRDRRRGSAFSIVTLTRHVRQWEINLADEERSTHRRNATEDPDVPEGEMQQHKLYKQAQNHRAKSDPKSIEVSGRTSIHFDGFLDEQLYFGKSGHLELWI
ncbi:hypothetical protein UY3_04104 [Chelonia mydas]|uniref:Uncharacterized protein n=1 Tax=Chelonia mydas TaxID=8469 RepID=M7BSQ6_CHEMY|nr:hypothetical protein UY3_04104 [Chelonia mydas]